jgi:hypothetical protein
LIIKNQKKNVENEVNPIEFTSSLCFNVFLKEIKRGEMKRGKHTFKFPLLSTSSSIVPSCNILVGDV